MKKSLFIGCVSLMACLTAMAGTKALNVSPAPFGATAETVAAQVQSPAALSGMPSAEAADAPMADYSLDHFVDNVQFSPISSVTLGVDEPLNLRRVITNHGPDMLSEGDTLWFDYSVNGEHVGSAYKLESDLWYMQVDMQVPIYNVDDIMTVETMNSLGLVEFDLCGTVRIGGTTVDPNPDNNSAYIHVIREVAEPCDAPSGLTADNVGANSALLRWTGTGIFEVNWRADDAESWQLQTVEGSVASVSGLEPATSYIWRVRKKCGDEDYSDWAESTFQTLAVGIGSHDAAGNMMLHPNPAASYVDIGFSGDLRPGVLSVYDACGKWMQTVKTAGNTVRIDVSGYAPGLYFVRASTPKGMLARPFVKR